MGMSAWVMKALIELLGGFGIFAIWIFYFGFWDPFQFGFGILIWIFGFGLNLWFAVIWNVDLGFADSPSSVDWSNLVVTLGIKMM